mgnify:CR=1 FL=1
MIFVILGIAFVLSALVGYFLFRPALMLSLIDIVLIIVLAIASATQVI